MVPAPDILIKYKRCRELGLPLVSGGVMNQPYLWLQEVAAITEQEALFKALEEKQREQEAQMNLSLPQKGSPNERGRSLLR